MLSTRQTWVIIIFPYVLTELSIQPLQSSPRKSQNMPQGKLKSFHYVFEGWQVDNKHSVIVIIENFDDSYPQKLSAHVWQKQL